MLKTFHAILFSPSPPHDSHFTTIKSSPLAARPFIMTPAEESRKRRNYDTFQSWRNRSISPPPKRHAASVCVAPQAEENRPSSAVNATALPIASSNNGNNLFKSTHEPTTTQATKNLFKSPMQLNFIEELPASSNVDCISLGSILGDPMIKECWLFNYLFDLDFVM